MFDISNLIRIEDFLWEIPKTFRGDMRVPARVYAREYMLDSISVDKSLEQLVNVATLPGIKGYALAMPDIHEGYGFPVGGVAAFDSEEGIVSPGGIGYDINCGVRLLRSEKTFSEIEPYLRSLGRMIYQEVPSGVGVGGRLDLRDEELDLVLEKGAVRMVELGYGEPDDLEHTESGGMLDTAVPELVSGQAKSRGHDQLGTMGAGNHFVEVGVVETVFDESEAKRLNIFKDQVTVLIHTGSRGLGHQIATDYIRVMMKVMPNYGIVLPDRELACAPFTSKEGQEYFKAMSAGANFAWANRQLITWEVRKAWEAVLGKGGGKLSVVYDVAHNIAKIEEYTLDGKRYSLVIHRKGATRAFPNQPVLIPGSMGTHSYILVGQEKALTVSFGSSCHGAGRRMSRTRARKEVSVEELRQRLESMGIVVNAGSAKGLTEEAPEAYKDVNEVVDVIHEAGIANKVARLKPVAVIKG
ncbi:MAG TPA: RtcB family protein [Thermodesulfobacteriota bacterium]|nr:RtcB family protein [Thermodesulfobacteriota bacterium]